jgi:hypothetical protein
MKLRKKRSNLLIFYIVASRVANNNLMRRDLGLERRRGLKPL